jgi:ribonuclease III
MADFGYKFKNESLLEQALTHPSIVVYQESKVKSYERLEFLGDSVLSCIMAEKVYEEYPNFTEGELSVTLANLVNAKSIVKVAHEINIADYIEMAVGEENSGGRSNPNNLENALEALIGAIFLDSDYDTVKKIVCQWWTGLFDDLEALSEKDNKSKLQELVQKKFRVLPRYKVEKMAGAAHEPTFTVSVTVNKYTLHGAGRTRKEAEQNAAELMLKKIVDAEVC